MLRECVCLCACVRVRLLLWVCVYVCVCVSSYIQRCMILRLAWPEMLMNPPRCSCRLGYVIDGLWPVVNELSCRWRSLMSADNWLRLDSNRFNSPGGRARIQIMNSSSMSGNVGHLNFNCFLWIWNGRRSMICSIIFPSLSLSLFLFLLLLSVVDSLKFKLWIVFIYN